MEVLRANNITKEFPGVRALEDVNITFNLGNVHCIIGENGAGKSTLIKILTGVYTADEGNISIKGADVEKNPKAFNEVSYIPQELELFDHMTVGENLFIPFSKELFGKTINNKTLYEKSIPILKKFKITANPNDTVDKLSTSNKQLLQIAQGFVHQESDIILLDEPTTSLSLEEVERLFTVIEELKNENKAIVFISHKLDEIFSIGDEISVLRNGKKVAYSEVDSVDAPWVIKHMTGKELNESMTYKPVEPAKEVLLEVDNLTGEKFKNISFKLYKGEILGFSGLVGAGRSEIMQTIFGYLPSFNGSVRVDKKPWQLGDTSYSINNGLVYIPEERKEQGLLLSLSVRENTTISLLDQLKNKMFISKPKERKLTHEVIDKYNVKTSSMEKEIKFLSGGNQQKVIIGRSLYSNPEILIFDEPTKGIDVGAKAEIYQIIKELAENGIGIILVSSELEELMKCSNRIISIYEGEIAAEFDADTATKNNIINSIMGVHSTN